MCYRRRRRTRRQTKHVTSNATGSSPESVDSGVVTLGVSARGLEDDGMTLTPAGDDRMTLSGDPAPMVGDSSENEADQTDTDQTGHVRYFFNLILIINYYLNIA